MQDSKHIMGAGGYGIIGIGLLCASLFVTATSIYCKECRAFEDSLSKEQKVKYNNNVRQRFMNYLVGLIIGIILAVAFYYYCCKESMTYVHVCVILAIIMGTQYLYYTLAPKSYIITDLTNDDQRQKWLVVYKNMKTKYHVGMLIGIAGCLAYCHGLLRK
jgi:undecaprenyl pyrophosphate phosphatase UppP